MVVTADVKAGDSSECCCRCSSSIGGVDEGPNASKGRGRVGEPQFCLVTAGDADVSAGWPAFAADMAGWHGQQSRACWLTVCPHQPCSALPEVVHIIDAVLEPAVDPEPAASPSLAPAPEPLPTSGAAHSLASAAALVAAAVAALLLA